MERITIAILIKLILIKSVASKRFGVETSARIFLSVFFPDDLSSSLSMGVREKNADSAAETKATTISNTSIVIKAIITLAENGLTIIVRIGNEVEKEKEAEIGTTNAVSFS